MKAKRVLPLRKIILTAFYLAVLLAISNPLPASSIVSVASRILPAKKLIFVGRELAFQYDFSPSPWSMRVVNISYDDFLWGEDVRWGATGVATLLSSDWQLSAGGGLSVAKSAGSCYQLSMDIYLKANYRWVFAELDTLFYHQGLFNQSTLGLEWAIPLSPQQFLVPFLGVGEYWNTDYAASIMQLVWIVGVRYAF